MPTALALIASEQLWPNIHSIEHWKSDLARVCIYHTPDVSRSREPAEKLKQFCAGRCPSAAVTSAGGAATPDAVAGQLDRWRGESPGLGWVVNATGGTKLMFDGAAALRGRPGVRVVYCELGPRSTWYELGRGADGTPTAVPFDMPAGVTDGIPVAALVNALWHTAALPVAFGPTAEELNVDELTAALIDSAGDWRAAFAAVGVPVTTGESGGILFERYIAAALRAFDLPAQNIARSVRQAGAGQPTQEVDVVINHGSRLRVLDCKLRAIEHEGVFVEGITSQLRQAAQTARRLGGLGGEVVLLRPNRDLTATELALADDLRVRVIGRSARECFFNRLGGLLGIPVLPDSLRRADELLATGDGAARAFPPSRGLHFAGRASGRGPVIELERLAGDWARDRPARDWAVVRIRESLYYLQFHNREGRSVDVLEDAVRDLLRGFGSDVEVTTTSNGNTLFALFGVDPSREEDFRNYLTAHAGGSLLD